MIGLGLTDLGLANAAMLAPPGPAAMAVGSTFMLLAGFPVVSSSAAQGGLLQTLTADAFRGRVFGALGAIQGMATLVGLTLGAVAIDAIGVVPVVSLGAAMWIVGGVFALTRLARDVGDVRRGPSEPESSDVTRRLVVILDRLRAPRKRAIPSP